MSGGKRLVAIEPDGSEAVGGEFLLTEAIVPVVREVPGADSHVSGSEVADGLPSAMANRDRLAAIAALLALLGWTAFFAWSQAAGTTPAAAPAQWAAWIRDWSVPVLLIGAVWQLAVRSGKRQAQRFAASARLLADESARLETRLAAINGELSLAREFVTAQARDLESVGRQAVDRLSQNADRLQALIHDNGAQVESIGTVSAAALDNMEKLRGQLPVIANSARDVTNNIGNAGRTAHAQLQEMIAGFKRLNEFGQASERQVESLRGLVDTTLAGFNQHSEELGRTASEGFAGLAGMGAEIAARFEAQHAATLESLETRTRDLSAELDTLRERHGAATEQHFARLTGQSGDLRRQLDSHEADAIASLRRRTEALSDELSAARERLDTTTAEQFAGLGDMALAGIAALEQRIEALRERSEDIAQSLHAREQDALGELTARLDGIDRDIALRAQQHGENVRAIAGQSEAAVAQLAALEQRLGEISAHVASAGANIAVGGDDLAQRLASGRDALSGAHGQIAELTESSVRLLELIQASSQHSRDVLPAAIADAESRLQSVESRVAAMLANAVDAANQGAQLDLSIRETQERLAAASREVEVLHGSLGERAEAHGAVLAGLRQSLGELEQGSIRAADHAQGELASAIRQLEDAARGAVSGIETTSASAIADVAAELGQQSARAIDMAMQRHAAEVTGKLEAAAARAAESGREAAVQLRDQLAMVNELAGNLERRVAHAREKAEEKVDNDFARRVALITEALNSNAIDIARALDADVSDTAWAAYLKGDRGIFTRRAVSLIQAGEAKAILQHYADDTGFRDHVSRYIHDFEAMLRQILSTRDGHALSVTLLSSDMGKLYVALAQAIERLRN